jgi:hypothetical protein
VLDRHKTGPSRKVVGVQLAMIELAQSIIIEAASDLITLTELVPTSLANAANNGGAV